MGTITKALDLLSYFSETASELGLSDFTKLTGRDKATVHRHLVELEANGYLEQNAETRKYRLGAVLLRLSSIRERSFPARRIVSHRVDILAKEIGELVHASLIQKLQMSPLYFRDESSGATRVNFSESELLPLHATASGMTALAFGPPLLLVQLAKTDLKKYSRNTPTDFVKLKEKIERVMADGFAYSDQAYEEDVCSFAVPFFEDGQFACGSVAIAVPASRLKKENVAIYVDGLRNASASISRELGGKIPERIKELWHIAA